MGRVCYKTMGLHGGSIDDDLCHAAHAAPRTVYGRRSFFSSSATVSSVNVTIYRHAAKVSQEMLIPQQYCE